MTLSRLRDAMIAGFCGTAAHLLLMWAKSSTGVLAEFQPYDDLQRSLAWLVGAPVHPAVPWLLSFVNGAVVWGFIFGRVYPRLPGNGPVWKGAVFGLCAWVIMGLVFLPMVGEGIFAARQGLGAAPALLMLAMLLVYSLTMSVVFHLLEKRGEKRASPKVN